ncbi:hypothetical protein EYC84_005531 [Monilinia fructicola]|uniref:Uncharacterized protein n=1 Tax=Monilinia fructicola TaxID=38448 RepID=A0A5M9JZP8_MONFR|nr:hypothetical protein EYC84_005531 [Monilinia fructicola]
MSSGVDSTGSRRGSQCVNEYHNMRKRKERRAEQECIAGRVGREYFGFRHYSEALWLDFDGEGQFIARVITFIDRICEVIILS